MKLLSVPGATAFPQAWLLGASAVIGGSCHKYNFCRGKRFVVTDTSRFVRFVDKHDKTFVTTNIIKGFVAASILLSRQKTCLSRQNIYRDKSDTCGSSRQ